MTPLIPKELAIKISEMIKDHLGGKVTSYNHHRIDFRLGGKTDSLVLCGYNPRLHDGCDWDENWQFTFSNQHPDIAGSNSDVFKKSNSYDLNPLKSDLEMSFKRK